MSSNPTLIPHFTCSNAAAAIQFYKTAFGAEEVARHADPKSDKVMHATLKINGGTVMLNDDFSGQMNSKCETTEALGGNPFVLHLQVDNADAWWDKAVSAGASVEFPLADQFWGDRYGMLKDPFGIKWSIAHPIKKLSPAEIEEAAKTAFV
jgi:PhnB protein